MRIRSIVCLICIFILFCSINLASMAAENNKGEEFFQLGVNYYDEGNLDKAIYFFEKAIEIEPDLAEAYFNLGIIYESLGDFEKAIGAINTLIRLNPENKQACLLLEQLNSRVKNQDQNIQKDETDSENKDAGLDLNKGEDNILLFEMKQDLERRACQLEIDYTKQPESLQIAIELGIVYRKLGRIDKSITILTESLNSNSENGELYEQLAISSYFKEDYTEFLDNIKKAQDLGYMLSQSIEDLAQGLKVEGIK